MSSLGMDLLGRTPSQATQEALARKELLLVLDGAEAANLGALDRVLSVRDEEQNAVLITSRRRSDAPPGTTPIDLPPLPEDDATDLLQQLATTHVDAATAERICELVGYLPLAVTLVGHFLNSRKTDVQEYLEWLEETPLDALDWEQRRERSVPLLLEHSLAQVSEMARSVLGVVGTLAFAPLDPAVVGTALELNPGERIRALGQLTDYGLLVRPQESPHMYTVAHALIHTYSRERLSPPEPTLDRLVDYIDGHIRGNQDDFPSLDPLRPHVMALVAACQSRRRHTDVLRLAWAMRDYLDLQGHWADRRELCEAAIQAAGASGNQYDEMAWLGNLGLAYSALGQVERAIDYHERALAISQEIGDRRGEGADLGSLGIAYRHLGQVEGAIDYYERALAISQEIGDRSGEGVRLGNLGIAYADLGQVERAIDYYERALAISQEIGDRRGEGTRLGNLGIAYYSLGQVERAIDYYERALAISQETGDRRGEGAHLGNLGNAYSALGQVERAIDFHERALAISQEIGDRRGEGTHLGNLGNAYRQQGDLDRAKACWQAALIIFTEIKSPHAETVRGWLAGLDEDGPAVPTE